MPNNLFTILFFGLLLAANGCIIGFFKSLDADIPNPIFAIVFGIAFIVFVIPPIVLFIIRIIYEREPASIICHTCKAKFPASAVYCDKCGTNKNSAPAVNLGNPTPVLVFGIIGLAFSGSGVIGLIFSIIALSKARAYIAQYGDVANQVRIGRRLAIAGLIISILLIIFWIIRIIILVVYISSLMPH